MRFDKIHIPAFGPFTNFSIDFEKSDHDIHLVYGANEAGKSSLLRGIYQMFYKMPRGTKDNFIHKNPNLRVGGTVSDDESQLPFLRKNGAVNTLLDSDGNTIDESELVSYLGAVDGSFFKSMFGLDTHSLRDGADALLSGKGDLGSQLFSASLGGSPIDSAIEKLKQESDKLFKGTGLKEKTILPALNVYKASEKAAKASITKETEWKALLKDIKMAETSFAEIDAKFTENLDRTRRLTNLTSAHPTYTKLMGVECGLEKNEAPEVSSDFVERFRKAHADYKDISRRLQIKRESIKGQTQELEAIPDYSAPLEYVEEIEFLTHGYKTYQTNLEAVDLLDREIKQIENTLKICAEQLELSSPDEISALKSISETVRSRFRKLVSALTEKENDIRSVESEFEEIESRVVQYEADLQNFSSNADTTALEALRQHCEKHDAGQSLQEEREEERETLTRSKKRLSKRLSIDSEAADIASLAVPSEHAIKEDQQREAQLRGKIDSHQEKIERYDEELAVEQSLLQQLEKQAAIFSHADLNEARSERDEILKGLTTTLSPGKTTDADDLNQLIDLTEKVHKADEIADALHSNAENITKAETHALKIETLTLKKNDSERYKQEVLTELEDWEADWKDRCAAIPADVASPTDLLQWRDQWEELCVIIDKLEELDHQLNKFTATEGALVEEILSTITSIDSDAENTFAKLFSILKSELKTATQGQGKLESAQEGLKSAKEKLRQISKKSQHVKASLDGVRADWVHLCSDAEIAQSLDPEQVLDLIDQRREAQEKSIDLSSKKKEVESKKDSVQNYNQQAQSLASDLLDGEQEVSAIVTRLKKQLSRAKQQQTKANTIQENITSEKKKLPELELKNEGLKNELSGFLQQAKVEDVELMEQAILEIETKMRLKELRESHRDTLQQLCKGRGFDVFCQELEELDSESAAQELADLEAEARLLKEERDTKLRTRDELIRQQEKLQEASDEAAVHKQKAANALASVVTDTERYIKLQHAITFLTDQVEAYRQKTQGPMIEKTSHYFSALTGGRYRGVVAQLDSKGVPQLVAIRRGAGDVAGEGGTTEVQTSGLSEGTGDQLYLSLRLAAIDLHLENHPPIPLILDDLLMTFDDERSKALFPVLKELSQKTQVLIFTHHRHLKSLAQKATPDIQIHQIDV